MKEDLIFHLVPRKEWNNLKKESKYIPQSVEDEGFIHCSSGNQIRDTANRLFKGTRRMLLLVINTTLVEAPIKYEEDTAKGQTFPHIYGPLNMDAIIDKIRLEPEEDGTFVIDFDTE